MDFSSLLDNFEFNKTIDQYLEFNNNERLTLIFMGDVLADRGSCDGFTLYILKRLHKASVKYKISISNHDLCFFTIIYGCAVNLKYFF